jgi:hypothetical protein
MQFFCQCDVSVAPGRDALRDKHIVFIDGNTAWHSKTGAERNMCSCGLEEFAVVACENVREHKVTRLSSFSFCAFKGISAGLALFPCAVSLTRSLAQAFLHPLSQV